VQPKIIITRPQHQADRFAADLQARTPIALDIMIAPLMEIVPVEPVAPLPNAKHLIFTSANGVAQADRLDLPRTATAWCVGDQTAEAAGALGVPVENAQGNSDDLVDKMITANPSGLILHLRGAHATGQVANRLNAAGLTCEEAIVYDQRPVSPPAPLKAVLSSNTPLIIPLFSPRSARLLATATHLQAPATCVAISETTARLAESLFRVDVKIASFPDKNGMIAAILGLYDADSASNMP